MTLFKLSQVAGGFCSAFCPALLVSEAVREVREVTRDTGAFHAFASRAEDRSFTSFLREREIISNLKGA